MIVGEVSNSVSYTFESDSPSSVDTDYIGGGSTRSDEVVTAVTETEPNLDLTQWMRSEIARQLSGQWVLLSPEYEVIDSNLHPRQLLLDHPEERAPFIVYVEHKSVRKVN